MLSSSGSKSSTTGTPAGVYPEFGAERGAGLGAGAFLRSAISARMARAMASSRSASSSSCSSRSASAWPPSAETARIGSPTAIGPVRASGRSSRSGRSSSPALSLTKPNRRDRGGSLSTPSYASSAISSSPAPASSSRSVAPPTPPAPSTSPRTDRIVSSRSMSPVSDIASSPPVRRSVPRDAALALAASTIARALARPRTRRAMSIPRTPIPPWSSASPGPSGSCRRDPPAISVVVVK